MAGDGGPGKAWDTGKWKGLNGMRCNILYRASNGGWVRARGGEQGRREILATYLVLKGDGEDAGSEDGVGVGEAGLAGDGGEECASADAGAGGPCGECGKDEDGCAGEEAGALEGGGDGIAEVDGGVLVAEDEPAAGRREGDGLVAVGEDVGAEGEVGVKGDGGKGEPAE